MAIGLAESMVAKGGIHEQHVGHTFRRNFEREPWRGYASGPPTVFSFAQQQGIPYAVAAKRLFGGQGSLGNGAAMRIVPVGLFFHDSPHLYDRAVASAGVTHAHPVGMDGAAVQALAVALATGLDPGVKFPLRRFLSSITEAARTSPVREKVAMLQHLIEENTPPDAAAHGLGRSVAVHESMPFALFSFLRHPHSFEDCIFCAILNGGDRDTLGAMAGAISGAYLGVGAIPEAWGQKLENRSYIASLALKLVKMRES
jgi:poly(ADP-ribose) glycohydrolase ARH3